MTTDVCKTCLWRAPDTCRTCAQEAEVKTDIITVWCMQCGLFMEEKDGRGQAGESHGLHEDCIEAWIAR